MATDKKSSKKIIFTTIGIFVIALFLIVIGVTLHNMRNHNSPGDIKTFVISLYNEATLPADQSSLTLNLSPTSCKLLTNTPQSGSFSTTTNCQMTPQIWDSITNAFITGNVPTQNTNFTPVTGPILLLGVYYNDGTSNTVYFSKPFPANFQNFLQTIKNNEPQINQL